MIDIAIPSCSCRGFQANSIEWCKHLSAVRDIIDATWDGNVVGDDPEREVIEHWQVTTALFDHVIC